MQLADIFQSTLSMRRATHKTVHALAFVGISIHALHEESDFSKTSKSSSPPIFQSTLSMRRATTSVLLERQKPRGFQSTLSMRRATGVKLGFHLDFQAISIHALHEESDRRFEGMLAGRRAISIHALHEESDRPVSGAFRVTSEISIHALHEESDTKAST